MQQCQNGNQVRVANWFFKLALQIIPTRPEVQYRYTKQFLLTLRGRQFNF